MTDNNESNMTGKIKGLAPWIGLGILTVGLMLVFKFSDQGYSNFQVKGSNLLAKYAENLSPFFVNSELTSEDVFNFALYNNLPIDKKENKVLTIESDLYGNENYVITSVDSLPQTNNLELYKNKLGLNSSEREQIDSILNNYKDDLYASILTADNKSIALRPKIALIQKAIGTDIYEFALKKREDSKGRLPEKNYAVENKDKIMAALRDKKDKNPEQYIFLTPDTVFSQHFAINKEKLNKEIKNLVQEKPEEKKHPDWTKEIIPKHDYASYSFGKIPEDEYNYQFDSNYQKLTLPASNFLEGNFVNYDSLKWSLDSLAKDVGSLHFSLQGFDKGLKMMVGASDGEKSDNVEIEFNFENLGDFISKTVSAATSGSPEQWEKFGQKMDSLSRALSTLEEDSTAFIKIKKAAEKIRKSRKRDKQNGE